jgi:hypothetical protein
VYLKQKWRTGGKNRSCLGDWYQYAGVGCRERVYDGDMVKILCKHACKFQK